MRPAVARPGSGGLSSLRSSRASMPARYSLRKLVCQIALKGAPSGWRETRAERCRALLEDALPSQAELRKHLRVRHLLGSNPLLPISQRLGAQGLDVLLGRARDTGDGREVRRR